MLGKDEIRKKGNEFYAAKDYEKALEYYNQAIDLDPDSREAWLNKGMCYKNLDQIAEAKQAFEKACQLSPDYTKAQYQLKLLELTAKAFFGIVDFKYTDKGEIKIFELGRGLHSNFQKHDELYPTEPMIEKKFIDAIGKIRPSCVGRANIPIFLYTTGSSNKEPISSRKISDYKGIFCETGTESPTINPDILILDDSPVWHIAAQNKYLTHQLFETDPELLKYRPRCKSYPLRYEANLADDIKKSIPGTKYILKVPDLTCGEGVMIVSADELEMSLRFLLPGEQSFELMCEEVMRLGYSMETTLAKIQQLSKHTEKWRSSNSNLFLVEEYCQSRKFIHKNAEYDPTIRAAFIITVDEGRAKFIPLGSYWKLPAKPLGEGEIREQHISDVNLNRLSSAKLSENDQKAVYKKLASCMPQVFLNMLMFDMPKLITQLKTSLKKSEQEEGDILAVHYLRELKNLNRTAEGPGFIKKTQVPEKNYNWYIQKAIAYSNNCQPAKAIQKYDKACKVNPEMAVTFFKSGQELLEKNRRALTELQKEDTSDDGYRYANKK